MLIFQSSIDELNKKEAEQNKKDDELNKKEAEQNKKDDELNKKEAEQNKKDDELNKKDQLLTQREEKVKNQEEAVNKKVQTELKDVMNTYFDETFRFAKIEKNNGMPNFNNDEIDSIAEKFGRLPMAQKEFLIQHIDKAQIQGKSFSQENIQDFLQKTSAKGYKGVQGMDNLQNDINPNELKKMMKNHNKPDVNQKSADKTANTKPGTNLRKLLENSSGSVSSNTHRVPASKTKNEPFISG